MNTVLALVDHPNLDLIIVPVLLELRKRGVQTKVLVTNAGRTELLKQKNISFQTEIDIEREFFLLEGNKLFLNAADQTFPAHAIGRKLDELCRTHGVPSLTLEHASFAMSAKITESYLFSADKMALVGTADYEEFRKLGVPSEKLVLTGFPPFDEYFEFMRGNTFVKGKYIYFAGQNHTFITGPGFYKPEEWAGGLRSIYRILLTNFPDLHIRVKPHPAEPYHKTVGIYSDAIDPEFKSRIQVVDSKYSNIQGISNSSFVVTFSSSVLLEALLLRKRAFMISISKNLSRGLTDAQKLGTKILQTSLSDVLTDIAEKFEDSIKDVKESICNEYIIPEDFLENYIYKLDGKSSERVAEVILKMMEDNKKMALQDTTGVNRPIFGEIGFERYQRLMGIAEEAAIEGDTTYTLLDIGSYDNALKKFVPRTDYFSYNNLISKTQKTFYEDSSFDVVVAADVLEHVRPGDRKAFLLELIRLAKKKVVFSFPSEKAVDFERFVLTIIPNHKWLQEHDENGLPDKSEIENIFNEIGVPYQAKPNHTLASWVYSVIFDNSNFDQKLKQQLNEFLQKRCFEMENNEPAYRYIYTVTIPQNLNKKRILQDHATSARERELPLVSIIIPVFNKVGYTQRCLEILLQNTPRGLYEVIIIDNASTDGTKNLLGRLTREFKIIVNDKNIGFAGACNQGAQAASTEYLLFLNNDTEPKSGWLEPLLEILEHDETVVAAGSKLLFPDNTIQHAGVIITNDKKAGIPLAPWHPFYKQPANTLEANIPRTYQALTAACLLIRKNAFKAVGGFDESYWNGYEDVDLCFKLGRNKWRLVYQPASIVIHHESQSGPERFNKRDQNLQLLQKKWNGIIAPDSVLYADGRSELTDAGKIQPYNAPCHAASGIQINTEYNTASGSTKKLKIGFLSLDKHSFACPQIRLLSALQFLDRQGWIEYVDLSFAEHKQLNIKLLQQLDILIVQRNFAKALPYEKLIAMLGEKRPKIIYEFDDAFGHLDKGHIAYTYYQSIRKEIEDYIRHADLVTVSTEMLKSYYERLNKNIAVIPNYINDEIWRADSSKQKRQDDKIRLLFSGTIGHEPDLKVIEKALVKILLEFKDTVELLLWGNHNQNLKQLSNVKTVSEFKENYFDYAQLLKNIYVDLAIVPLQDTCFNRAKSHIKWLEYSACRIPGIYSNVGEYHTTIKNGVTGILVNNTFDEWYQAIRKLITDESFRDKVAQNAYEEVMKHYTFKKNATKWLFAYLRLFEEPQKVDPVISIIIPVYNKLDFTKQCLQALSENTPQDAYEIIIVDNGSTDGTRDYLGKLPIKAKVITNKKNLGFAKACNQGTRVSSTDYLLFLNNDTEPQQGWLKPLLNIITHDNSVAAVGSKLLYPDGTIQHGGILIVDDQKNNDPLLAINNHVNKPANAPEANEPATYQALSAACLLIRKAAFQKTGSFDEEYWNGYEDVDLSFTLREQGGKLVYQPESVVIHHESKSGPERFSKVRENIARLHKKWLGKIKPDAVLNENGSMVMTDVGIIQPYHTPDGTLQQLVAMHTAITPNMVSIIILTFNQIKYTKECVESIRNHTPEPHEIIFVDNGSTDGTVKWIKHIIKDNPHYRLIENKKNLGFPKGCNQGINASSGEYILLLNNDVIVTDGWLSGMLECLNSSPDIGIVGPMTDNISGIQKVPADYGSLNRLDDYARAFRELNRYRRIPARRIVGFCMLFKRELAEKIGLLDENFVSGNFEDDDYCLRAAMEGYRNIIAGDVFIHHYGSRSFVGNRIDYSSAMAENKKIFRRKWNGIDAKSPLGKKLLSIKAMETADHLSQKGSIEKAVEKFVEGLKISPDEKSIYFALSEMLIAEKQFKGALDVLQGMSLIDENLLRLILIGYCKEGLELYEEAEGYASRVLSLDAEYAQALNLKGILEYRKGDKHAAEDFFQKAIASDPSYGESYTNLGVLKWADRQSEKALNLMERGFILAPTIMDMAIIYHSAVTQIKGFERAERIFRSAKDIYPFNRRIAFLLIDILIQQGKNETALHEIQEAMIKFGIDDGIISAAFEVRNRIAEYEIGSLSEKKSTLSLCMIVKNEERHLARCLMSVKTLVDEMVVVDTGSTDRTKDIAKIFGAKVYDFEWTNDFSQARNFSILKASGEWILVLDADEVISAQDSQVIKEIVQTKGKTAAYSLITRNYVNEMTLTGWTPNDGRYSTEEAGSGWFPSKKVRLFPNDSRIQFENPVHELVESSLDRAGIKTKECKVPIHHYGKLNNKKIIVKGEDYYLLGKEKLSEKDGDTQALFELAVQATELRKYDEAVELWQRFLSLEKDIPEPFLTRAYLNMGGAYLQLGRYEEALSSSKKAMEMDPDLKEAVINYSLSEFCIGDVRKVINVLENFLFKVPEYVPAAALLSSAYFIDGNKEKGLEYLNDIKKTGVNCSEYFYEYARMLFSSGNVERATLLIDAAIENNILSKDILILLSKCYKQTIN